VPGTSITDVGQLSLAEVEDELYSLTPAEFIAVRDERARQARAAGQRDVAAAIKKLGRPTASAWLVNQLARDLPDQMNHLFEVGEALHEAQRSLAGDRLRELSADRRRAVADLLPEASRLATQARQAASATVLGEVKATLEAAVADPEARAAVRSGRLTKALVYAGIGEVDLTAALAAVPESPGADATTQRPGRKARAAEDAHRAAEPAEGDAAATERAVKAAEREASAAEAALEKADREAASLEEQRQFLRRRLDHLERELEHARAEDAQLSREARDARSRAEQARARAQAAAEALRVAQDRHERSPHR
jgi:hypothetical protein